MIDEKQVLIWSKSRFLAMEECERKLYFSVSSADEKINILKKLINRHVWTGAHIKRAVSKTLRSLRQGDSGSGLADILAQTKDTMRQDFRQSKTNAPFLFEHYYNKNVSDAVWQQHWRDVEKSLEWFYSSSWMKRLKEMGPENWKVVDDLLEFDVGGIKAYVKMDCALEIDDRTILIQWKGAPIRPADENNLAVAALYAHDVWDKIPENIDCFAVSLAEGKSKRIHIDEEILMETQLRIQEQTAQIQERMERHGDNPDSVPMTTHLGHCLRCNFQQLCHPDGIS